MFLLGVDVLNLIQISIHPGWLPFLQDVKKIHAHQQTCKTTLEEMRVFEHDFNEERRRLRRDDINMLSPAEKGSLTRFKKKAKEPFPNLVSQKEAKKYLPPGASIWRGRTKMTWNGHCPPRRRISEPWGADEQAALALILRRLWDQYLQLSGKESDECPFDLREAVTEAAAASSSA